MKKQSTEALKAYYAEGDSWAHDRQDMLRRSRRVAWWMAGAAATVAVCEAIALVVLMPLKTVTPYTLMVDRQTGFVQTLKPLDPQQISGDAALTQSFLVQYVIAREGFDIGSVQADYRKVALWSVGPARSAYVADMQTSSGASPLSRYPRSTVIDVEVKSVTALSPQTAMVRFETRRRDAGGAPGAANAWVSVVRYGYSGAPMSVANRYVNPLGFQVSRYRRSAETLPSRDPVPAAPPPPPTVSAYPPAQLSPVIPAPSGLSGYPRIVPPAPAPTR